MHDGVAWLTLDKAGASANSLSRDVMEELDAMLDALERAPPKALIVTSGKAAASSPAPTSRSSSASRTPDAGVRS